MQRIVLRNLAIIAIIALPLTLLAAAAWISLFPVDGRAHNPPRFDADALAEGVAFWWVLLILPALVLGLLHQVVLAALPHDWPRWRLRLSAIGSSVLGAALCTLPFVARPGADWRGAMVAVVAGATVYGMLARPVQPRDRITTRSRLTLR